MISNQYAEKLNELSRALTKVHRSILDFQKKDHEQKEERKLTPYEALHLAIKHPDFDWMRAVSSVISEIDELVGSKTEVVTEEALKSFKRRINELFQVGQQHVYFRQRLDIAMERDPNLCLEVAEIRSLLEKLP